MIFSYKKKIVFHESKEKSQRFFSLCVLWLFFSQDINWNNISQFPFWFVKYSFKSNQLLKLFLVAADNLQWMEWKIEGKIIVDNEKLFCIMIALSQYLHEYWMVIALIWERWDSFLLLDNYADRRFNSIGII